MVLLGTFKHPLCRPVMVPVRLAAALRYSCVGQTVPSVGRCAPGRPAAFHLRTDPFKPGRSHRARHGGLPCLH
jgi:hypothetical protein